MTEEKSFIMEQHPVALCLLEIITQTSSNVPECAQKDCAIRVQEKVIEQCKQVFDLWCGVMGHQ